MKYRGDMFGEIEKKRAKINRFSKKVVGEDAFGGGDWDWGLVEGSIEDLLAGLPVLEEGDGGWGASYERDVLEVEQERARQHIGK